MLDLVLTGGSVVMAHERGLAPLMRRPEGASCEVGRIDSAALQRIAAYWASSRLWCVDIPHHYDGSSLTRPRSIVMARRYHRGRRQLWIGFAPVRPWDDSFPHRADGGRRVTSPFGGWSEVMTWRWEHFPLPRRRRVVAARLDVGTQGSHSAFRAYVLATGERPRTTTDRHDISAWPLSCGRGRRPAHCVSLHHAVCCTRTYMASTCLGTFAVERN